MPNPERKIEFRGVTRTLGEWAKIVGVPASTLNSRLNQQRWTVERALTTPLDKRFGRKGGRLPDDMPRPVPKLKRHRKRNLAYVTWHESGQQHYRYFGEWGSTVAAEHYRRFAAEWISRPPTGRAGSPDRSGPRVGNLVRDFITWARSYYTKDGTLTSSFHLFRVSLCRLAHLYGSLPIAEFGADQLRAFVRSMVDEDLSLGTVNRYQWCVVFAFSWGVTRGNMVPPGVVHVLERVEKQIPGRSAARESEPVKAAPLANVEAVIPYLHKNGIAREVFTAAIRLQLVSGLRPGEVCAMRVSQVDRSGELWRYEPRAVNKNRHRAKARIVWLGPRAQAILGPMLIGLDRDDPVFGYARRPGEPRQAITVNLYCSRVARACKAANVPGWHPHQLRHNRATELQRRYECDEAVRVGIGDTPEVARQVYVDDPADAVGKRIAKETG